MGSRRVYQMSGIFLVMLGVFGKIGGVFSTVPASAIGGNGIIFIGILKLFNLALSLYVY